MKIYNKIFAVALAGLAFASCADLDTEPTGSTLTTTVKQSVVADNPEKVSASVSGITALYSVYMNVVDGNHNDFGYPSIMLFTDSRGNDMVCDDVGYNWFSGALDLISDRKFDSDETNITWQTLYNQIFAANSVAASIDVATEDPTSQFFLAQALAIRAFDYFNLVQFYAFNYKGHENDKSVPVITEENQNEVATDGAPRATVQEVYDQILSDLDAAVELLGKTSMKRADKRYIDLAVALGLRARVNLTMQNWAAAEKDAKDALAATSATPISIAEASKPGFKKMTENNWMWGILISETDRVVTSGIVNWQSHMGSFNYGYCSQGVWRRINQALFDQIPASDVRRGWFLDANGNSENLSDEFASYAKSMAMLPYTQVKFAPYKDEIQTSTNSNDIILMRVEELYYIAAEAQAMGGKTAEGVATLTDFVTKYRNPEYNCLVKNPKDIQEEIWLQRRVEFWGEGQSYFDIMRHGEGFSRVGAGFAPQFVFDIAGDDPILIFDIPESEYEANPQIAPEENPVVSKPVPVTE